MSGPLRIQLKTGEKVWINGALLTVDRKTQLTLYNDAKWLLHKFFLPADRARTPFEKLYVGIQGKHIDNRPCDMRVLFTAAAQISDDNEKGTIAEVMRDVSVDNTIAALSKLRPLIPAFRNNGI